MNMELRERYDKLKAQHSLPDYSKLNSIFEIESIESETFLLRAIRRHIIEIVKVYIEIIEDIIHPNSTVSAFHECKFFDEDKKSVYDVYGKLMTRLRRSNVLDITQDDRKDADFIKEVYADWPSIKADLLSILTRLERCWVEEEMTDKSVSYFG
jgi:hypothetical protein